MNKQTTNNDIELLKMKNKEEVDINNFFVETTNKKENMKNTLNKYGLAITNPEELKGFFGRLEDNQEDEGFFHWDKKVYINVKDNEIGECESNWDLSEFPEEIKILRNIHKTHKILTIMIDSEEWIIFFKNDIFASNKEDILTEINNYLLKLKERY